MKPFKFFNWLMSFAAPATSKKEASIQQVTHAEVRGCKFLANIQGFSGWGKVAMGAWRHKAKHRALQQASALGATHVVWTRTPKNYGSDPYIYGEAYRCDDAEKLAPQKSSFSQESK